MKLHILGQLLVILSFVFGNFNVFSQSTMNQSIIGGVNIDINQAPYQVSLQDANGNHFCGGIILSDRWILSAFHCLDEGVIASNVTVHAGSTDRTDNTKGQRILAQTITLGPFGWTTLTRIGDVALIELSAPLQFNENVQPVKYANLCNTTINDLSISKIGFLSGWGRTCWNCSFSQTLKGLELPIISSTLANQINQAGSPGISLVTNNMIPFYSSIAGIYTGDSGGPVVIKKNDNKINIGSASWGLKHPDTIYPSVYVNVRDYATWIETTTGIYASRSGVDLYLQDRPWDMANEPNNVDYAWMSEDIWVRNQADGFTVKEHQNPEFQTGSPVYVYVRVRNNGCEPSLGTEYLTLNWAKAATDLIWPNAWDGTTKIGQNGPIAGEPIDVKLIPTIEPGSSEIIEFEWTSPNPTDYTGINPEPWHFCLLARVEATNDPMAQQEISNLNSNVVNNNNIGWKNVTIVNDVPGIVDEEVLPGGVIAIGNMNEGRETFDFEFVTHDFENALIYEEAEVKLTLDETTWQIWMDGGNQAENIEIFDEQKRQLLVTNNSAWLKNLSFESHERSTIHVSFNFLTEEVTEHSEFDYFVVQRQTDGSIIGGENYHIIKTNPERDNFLASGGSDKNISKTDSIELVASSIGEPAIYNWYNSEGDLIYTGMSIMVSPEITEKYKLEVIAIEDGYKDYDEVTVNVKQHEIKSISPNPASNTATLVYRIENAVSAYLQLTTPYGTTSNNYILDLNQNQIVLDLSSYPIGNYSVILVVDGVLVDTKSLSKQ